MIMTAEIMKNSHEIQMTSENRLLGWHHRMIREFFE
jgi:hypothetical protein